MMAAEPTVVEKPAATWYSISSAMSCRASAVSALVCGPRATAAAMAVVGAALLAVAWAVYRPQMAAYVQRAENPTEAPSYGVPGDE